MAIPKKIISFKKKNKILIFLNDVWGFPFPVSRVYLKKIILIILLILTILTPGNFYPCIYPGWS